MTASNVRPNKKRFSTLSEFAYAIKIVIQVDMLDTHESTLKEMTRSLREDFLRLVRVWSRDEVIARVSGQEPSAAQRSIDDWRVSRRIIAIQYEGRELYPAFQFDEAGRLRHLIKELLDILHRDPDLADWDMALWFAGDTGWLDGLRPIDCLESDVEGVKHAAEQEALLDTD